MKTKLLTLVLLFTNLLSVSGQVVYVDSNSGNDSNPGTELSPFRSLKKATEIVRNAENNVWGIKINPGIYLLEHLLSIETDKINPDNRIIIEASVLPDEPDWTPEKMPVIFSVAPKGELPEDYHFVASFLINESHVTIRGLKFTGYAYPNTRYFPIARLNKEKSDLYVEQCLFTGDEDASHLQVGIIANGDGVRADHCIFYNVRNSVVFWQDSGNGFKKGNGITNSIIYGATQSGIWTSWPDADFVFKNNVVSNCLNFWIKNADNPTVYTIDNCLIVDNTHNLTIADNAGVHPQNFEIIEKNVKKEGTVYLVHKSAVTHEDLPIDYLHVQPGTPGFGLGAGLFKTRNK